MLAVTPTNLLRLRPYDLSDARHLVEQFDVENSKNCQFVLEAMNDINYETARLYVQGQTTLYYCFYSKHYRPQLKTDNDGLLRLQPPYCTVDKPEVVVYLQNDTLAKPKQLKEPVPEGHFCLINDRIYIAQKFKQNKQTFMLEAVPQKEKDKIPKDPKDLAVDFEPGTQYTEIGVAIII